MSRISSKFDELSLRGEAALVSYIMAGYPDEKATIHAARGLVRGGADIIELGFPFSDPLADGPVIQDAAMRSLDGGMNMDRFFKIAGAIRRYSDVPLVMMTYANILHRRGYSRIVREAAAAGIDGFVVPDMSIGEADGYLESVRGMVDPIFLISPNTGMARLRRIAGATSGFLYLVAVYGTTGARTGVQKYTIRAIRDAKRAAGARIPVAVGFGISEPSDVQRYVSAGADAVVVGSALLRLIGGVPQDKIESRVASMTRRLKRATKRL